MIIIIDGKSVLIDEEDYDIVKNYNWRIYSLGYPQTRIFNEKTEKLKTTNMHQLIMNSKVGDIVDHINMNPLDNRKENLRITNHNGNNKNNVKYSLKNATSIYKGVSAKGNNWRVSIDCDGVKHYIGSFTREDVAGYVYNVYAEKLHKEFAQLNNVESFDNWEDYRVVKKRAKYKGVYYMKDKKCWRATIRINGKNKHIGYYTDEIACANAYNSFALKFNLELNEADSIDDFENYRLKK